jgi:hypothetical protein
MRALVVALALVGACSSPNILREPDEFVGCATDENWRTFDDQQHNAVVADATAPAVTQPNLTAPVPAKSVFKWNQDPNDPGMDTGDVPHDGPGCNNCCPEYNIGALTTAHLPPISGNVYDLQFSSGDKVVYRVMTTLQEWTAPDAVWASWKGQSLSLRIYRMQLLSNDLRPGVGGPFVASHGFNFTVAP